MSPRSSKRYDSSVAKANEEIGRPELHQFPLKFGENGQNSPYKNPASDFYSSAIDNSVLGSLEETARALANGRANPELLEDVDNPDVGCPSQHLILDPGPGRPHRLPRQNLVLVRPTPLKTTLSVVDPGIIPSKSQNVDQEGSVRVDSRAIQHTEENAKVIASASAAVVDSAWCQKATSNQREEKRKRELARQRRRQQAQCAFPESNHHPQSMPPASARGNDGSSSTGSGELRGAGTSVVNHPNADDQAGQPPPLFERFITEEVQELKACMRIMESQAQRIEELEKTQRDLESRLEGEVRGRRELESTLETRERDWQTRFVDLEKERDHYMEEVEKEKTNNKLLVNTVKRTEQDIHRMLQRKYDQEGQGRATVRNASRQGGSDRTSVPREPRNEHANQSPWKVLDQKDMKERAQVRNAKGLALDFFGL